MLAGGQSLLPVLRMRLNAPEMIVDINGIDSLREIRDEGDTIVIGAMAPYYEILANDSVKHQPRACSTRRSPRWPTRRSGTAAPSVARWCTPTRRATAGRRRWRWTPSW